LTDHKHNSDNKYRTNTIAKVHLKNARVEVCNLNKGSAMKKPFLQLTPEGSYELLIEGVISGEEWWGDEFTPSMVREELAQANGKPLKIIINSPGGEVFAGAAIYNALLQYEGKKTVRIDGVAASMASVIAMVGEDIQMSPGSTMMIHRPMVGAYGNIKDLNKAIKVLEALEETLLPIYENRTGLSHDEVFNLLDEETWMSPEGAVELGFADSVSTPKVEQVSAFDKIKAMLSNEQFAFSMNAMHKSLEHYVAEAEAPETKENTQVETKEEKIEEVATPVVETTEVVDTPVEPETPVVEELAETEVEEVVETPIAEIKPINLKKETPKMSKELKTDEVVAPVALADPAVGTVVAKDGITKNEYKTRFVEMLSAAYNGEKEIASAKAKDIQAVMVIDGTTGSPVYGGEVLSTDIRDAYTNVGRVGALVNRIDIEGAETFKQLVETAGAGFRPVSLGGTKQEDQPVWTPVSFEPHEFALIVAWLDGVQKRSPIAIYNQIVKYIARQYSKLEDTIILTWAGGTFGGETFPSTGLVPALVAAGRVTPVASYTSAAILPAIGAAYGSLETDQPVALVTNRSTWGAMATTIDGEGRAAFTVVGDQVSAGALGTFNVVLSEVLADGDVVLGAYDDYNLVTRGGLSTLFSREATVGSLNLFTQDASALRADVDITGGAVAIESFELMQFTTTS